MTPYTDKVPVAEIFGPVIQGEGAVIGVPTVFIRTGGCDYRCAWCDSLHAVLPEHASTWVNMTTAEIVRTVCRLAPHQTMVTLSGGNPALHRGLGPALQTLRAGGYPLAMETQGTVIPPWLGLLDDVIISPKPPSSGELFDLPKLKAFVDAVATSTKRLPRPRVSIKIVAGDDEDLDFAASIFSWFHGPRYVQPVNPIPESDDYLRTLGQVSAAYHWLCGNVANRSTLDRLWTDVRVTPQAHVFAYGNKQGR